MERFNNDSEYVDERDEKERSKNEPGCLVSESTWLGHLCHCEANAPNQEDHRFVKLSKSVLARVVLLNFLADGLEWPYRKQVYTHLIRSNEFDLPTWNCTSTKPTVLAVALVAMQLL